MRRLLIPLLLLTILLTAALRPGHADPHPPCFVPGEVLVKFQPDLSPKAVAALAASCQARPMDSIPRLGIWRLRVEPGLERATATALAARKQVLYAEPNYLVHVLDTSPDDPYYPLQWNLDKIQAPDAWRIARGDASMPVAIIDTGIDPSHPDLAAKLWVNGREVPSNGLDDDGNGYIDDVHGYDFVNGDGEPEDEYGAGHGTHVSGIIAAATDNGLGVAGVAPENPLMALKVIDSSGEGTYFDVARAIDYALAQGVRVMNLSLGGVEASEVMSDAVQMATAAGALLVAAAGNDDGSNPLFYPAAYDEVLAVAATNSSDGIASFSVHHPYIDVAAPGVDIYSTYRGGGYGYMSGTSMAAPHVSGLAALVWAVDPGLTREGVVERIVEGAEDLGMPGRDDYYGWGRINAWATLRTMAIPLSVTPSRLSFMADSRSLSVPASQTVWITNSGSIPLTWTATISPPSASWVYLTPISGTLERGGSQPLQIEVDSGELGEAYGDYTSQLRFASTDGVGEADVYIHLHYVPLIYQLIFLLIYRNASLAIP